GGAGRGDEGMAIVPSSGDRQESEARSHVARIARHAEDLGLRRAPAIAWRGVGRQPDEELAEASRRQGDSSGASFTSSFASPCSAPSSFPSAPHAPGAHFISPLLSAALPSAAGVALGSLSLERSQPTASGKPLPRR